MFTTCFIKFIIKITMSVYLVEWWLEYYIAPHPDHILCSHLRLFLLFLFIAIFHSLQNREGEAKEKSIAISDVKWLKIEYLMSTYASFCAMDFRFGLIAIFLVTGMISIRSTGRKNSELLLIIYCFKFYLSPETILCIILCCYCVISIVIGVFTIVNVIINPLKSPYIFLNEFIW